MIPVPPELARAIEAPERQPLVRLSVDWDRDGHGPTGSLDDLTGHVGGVTIGRAIGSDLPEPVRLVEGSAAAALDADLVTGRSSDERAHAAWYFSRVNPSSPLAGKERLARPVTCDIGFLTDEGPRWVRRFTGSTRGLPVDAATGTATLHALDGRERLRARVALPMVVADGGPATKPGLNAQWPLDYVLRRNGLHASPPVRARCVASATMHGSAHAEVGTTYEAGRAVNQDPESADWLHVPLRFVPGRFALALAEHPNDPDTGNVQFVKIALDRAHPVSTNNGATLLVECWSHVGDGDSVSLALLTGENDAGACQVRLRGGVFEVAATRLAGPDAPSYTVTGPTLAGPRAWRYLAAHVSFTPTGVTVDFRVDAATTTRTVATAPATGQGRFVRAVTTAARPIEAWQITAEPRGAPWNDTFQPGALLGASLNDLTAILPGPARDSWELLGEIAAAEAATVGFDEAGVIRFRNRARWVQPDAQTVQRTLTATRDITALGYDDAIDTVRNRIRVPASPVTVGPLAIVWRAPDVIALPPRTAHTVWAALPDPVTALRLPILPGTNPDGSFYLAQDKPTGGGTAYFLTIAVEEVAPDAVKLRITNPHPRTLYLVDNSGTPALVLRGQFVTASAHAATPEAADPASIAEFGEQPLDVAPNPWRQSADSAAGLAAHLLADLAWPRPAITDLEIIGDPRLQLGDRVRIHDPDGIALDGHYWLAAITDRISPGRGYTQRVTARQATTVLRWADAAGNGGRWDEFVWGE